MRYIPVACFALIPFGIWGQSVFYGHANTLILSSLLLLFLFKDENAYPINTWVKCFGAYLCGWVIAGYTLSFMDLNKLAPWFYAINDSVFLILAGLIFYKAVYRGDIPLSLWGNVICLVATLQSLLGIMQVSGFDPVVWFLKNCVELISTSENAAAGTLGNQNFLAAYLAISIPFFLNKDESFRKTRLCLLPVILVALLLTKTTTAFAAAIVGVAFLYGGVRWAVISVLPAVVIYGIKYQNAPFSNERIMYWKDAWESTTHGIQTLIFGWGPGVTWKPGNMLHSEYANTFFNYGLIGVLLMLAYFVSTTIKAENRYLQAAVLIIAVNIIGNHAFHLVSTATLALVVFALNERENRESMLFQ